MMTAKQGDLFPDLNPGGHAPKRGLRNLFLPKYLQRESLNQGLRNASQEKAYHTILKWADLEESGKLARKKETALEGEFLSDVFGQALGYILFSENIAQWNIEPQYSVNTGTADAAIGVFQQGLRSPPVALIELKGPTVDLDRDRFRGRTAVHQLWDYLNAVPECPWGIVSNYASLRIYHRDHTPRACQIFRLQDLRRERVFRQFYYLLERGGLLPAGPGHRPRALLLLEQTGQRQRQVGDELYEEYNYHRNRLVEHLVAKPHAKPLETAIGIAQKLLDRIIFIAFCEDRGLLPDSSIKRAYSELPPFSRVTNPRWRNFLNLFRSIDEGNSQAGISPYNGGLFREDKEVDDLQLDDSWTNFFDGIGRYDFRDEVNVDVLGHLFERSVNDVGRMRTGGLLGEEIAEEERPKMAKSAQRKRYGIYYTPPEFTSLIVSSTVAKVVGERLERVARETKLKIDEIGAGEPDPQQAQYWHKCFQTLQDVKIVDPACGSGAFLIKAYDFLEEKYEDIVDHLVFHEGRKAEALRDRISDVILQDNLFGVDVSPEAVEITQLALWIRSARYGRTLADLSGNIVCGNSLVSDPRVHPRAMEWENVFADVFARDAKGFDCVIGNPPWERMKLQEREFFDTVAPQIAAAVNAATRRRLIAALEKEHPELHERYSNAKTQAERTLGYVRTSGRYPLTGKGDINTYAAFAELAHSIVARHGCVGLLVPSGIATDHTTREFFGQLTDSDALIGLYDFENKAPVFPDVHRSFKFCVLLFGGPKRKTKSADFVFFARKKQDLEEKNRHIALSADDIQLLNPNTRTCPIFRSRHDAELTKAIYSRVPVLVDKNRGKEGNPWGIKFMTMFHQTNDAELFHTAEQLRARKYKREGAQWTKGKKTFLPLYEAKMVQMYDHRAASVIVDEENWMRQGQTQATLPVQHENPDFFPEPRWWVDEKHVRAILSGEVRPAHVCFKDVTSPTNVRTMIAAFVPFVGALNSAPILLTGNHITVRQICCLLANLNSFPFDFVARQKVGGVHLNFFIVEQLPMFPPAFYLDRCPWSRRQTSATWISQRALKLTCTSTDMRALAIAAGFSPEVYRWNTDERIDLQAQLDAAFFLLYGIDRDDVEYILSTFSGTRATAEGSLLVASPCDLILKHYDALGKRSRRSS